MALSPATEEEDPYLETPSPSLILILSSKHNGPPGPPSMHLWPLAAVVASAGALAAGAQGHAQSVRRSNALVQRKIHAT